MSVQSKSIAIMWTGAGACGSLKTRSSLLKNGPSFPEDHLRLFRYRYILHGTRDGEDAIRGEIRLRASIRASFLWEGERASAEANGLDDPAPLPLPKVPCKL